MIIYKVTNIINGKCYIGQTNNLHKRKSHHILVAKKKSTLIFHRALLKYGVDTFIWEVLCECETKEELDEMEFHYIKQYNSFGTGGYNMTLGGDGGWGHSVSLDARKRIGDFNRGKKRTEEEKEHLRQLNTGKTYSDETKEKHRVNALIWWSSDKNKDERSIKIGNALRGKCKTDSHKEIMSHVNPSAKPCVFVSPDGEEHTGHALKWLCRKLNLSYDAMRDVLNGKRNKTRDGWSGYWITP